MDICDKDGEINLKLLTRIIYLSLLALYAAKVVNLDHFVSDKSVSDCPRL